MDRPRLRRLEPGRYQTLDRRFLVERRSCVGPRGGVRYEWHVNDNGPAFSSLHEASMSLLEHVRGWSGLSADSGFCYLVHFDEPYRHAGHYLGYTNLESVSERMKRHRAGEGARLLAVLNEAGIGYEVVRIWPGGRARERQLKKQHSPALCPTCRAAARAS
jgi:hypothetical protein